MCRATYSDELAAVKFSMRHVVPMTVSDVSHLCLGEGVAVEAFDSDAMLGKLKISPYDAFALFLHARAPKLEKPS